MKNKIFVAVLALSGITFAACSDYLDETPKGTIIPETVDDFGMMLDDAITTTSSRNHIAYGIHNTMTMDDDVVLAEIKSSEFMSFEVNGYLWEDQLYSSGSTDYDYYYFYKVIYICNYILANIDDAEEGDNKYDREEVKGGAYFHRANAYLNLVNEYATHYNASTASTDLGVPLSLDADPNQRLARSTVQEVYDQILSDAKTIVEDDLLPDEVEYSFRPCKAAVYALLMRTYLYMFDYSNSYAYAVKARAEIGDLFDYNELYIDYINPDFGLGDNWVTSMDYGYEMPDVICYKYLNTSYCWVYEYNVSEDLLAIFDEENDLRYRYFLTKYAWYDDYNEDDYGMRICELYDYNKGYGKGEVYITEAETALRLNDVSTALECLNALRVKRMDADTYEAITETNTDALMEIILQERRRELMFKGLRWFDLKRLNREGTWQKTVVHEYGDETYTLEPNDARYVVQFPQSVIDVNPLIEQNER